MSHTDRLPLALIADDDEMMQLMLSEAAASAGFEAHTVGNGKDAVTLAAELNPDIFLLDVNMPIMDGFAACERLRCSPEHRLTPIVVVTGDDDSESIDRAYQSGATDFVSKPINWSLLAHRLRYILRGAENLKTLHAREQKIHRLAYFDDLTGLPNRAMLRERIEDMVQTSVSDDTEIAVIHLDLDGFKRVNDSFGQKVGDKMLAAVARRLNTSLEKVASGPGENATLARVGGDEFVVALRAEAADELAVAIAEEWIDCLQLPFKRDGNELHMTPSIGLACSPDHGDSAEALLKNAGAAMNASKRTTAGAYTSFCDDMRDAALSRVQFESALRDALRHNRLEMHYQPKYSVADGQIAGLEALMRWHDSKRGWVSPLDIVALAEESGLILDINRWVVDTVCSQLADWCDRGVAVPVAINISATEFVYGDPVALIRDACARHDIDPSLIEVEITESTLLNDVESTCAVLAELKALDVCVSVDDFGTGYSSLAYLKRFDIDVLKIDRSFVDELGSSSEDRAICRAMIALARSLSLSVVAEGVETFEQHSWLASHSCDYVQGYLWSKPLNAVDVSGLLLESDQAGADDEDRNIPAYDRCRETGSFQPPLIRSQR